MKLTSKLLALAIVAGGTMFAQPRLSVGIRVGGYAQPPVYNSGYSYGNGYGYDRPPMPGPGYLWVDGYWGVNHGHRFWNQGYWSAPVYREYRRDFDRHDFVRRDFDRRDDRRDYRRDDRRDDYRDRR